MIETVISFLTTLMQTNTVLFIVIIVVILVVALKFMQYLLKIVTAVVIFAAFPFIANAVGIPIPMTFSNIIWYAFMGLIIYFAFSAVAFALKVTKLITYPFKGAFEKKKTKYVYVKEKKKPKR